MIKLVFQIPIALQPTIEPFVGVKKVTADIRLPNVEESNHAHTMLNAIQTWHADKENASIHVLPNAIIVANAKS